MSIITIKIRTDSKAFDFVGPDGMNHALPDILESLANYIREENQFPDWIYDSNQDIVGKITEELAP